MKTNFNQRVCGNCAFWRLGNGVCVLENEQIPATEMACRKFKTQIEPCDLCHRYSIKIPLLRDITDEQMISVCDDCFSKYNTCITCKEAVHCEFETNSSSTPKFIQKEIRQGNFYQVTTVKNPVRIAELCKDKCPCFDPEIGCLRENNNTCEKWEIRHEKV
jgi:hypothetical protein